MKIHYHDAQAGHMAKMAATPIYGKLSPDAVDRFPRNFGMEHWGPRVPRVDFDLFYGKKFCNFSGFVCFVLIPGQDIR